MQKEKDEKQGRTGKNIVDNLVTPWYCETMEPYNNQRKEKPRYQLIGRNVPAASCPVPLARTGDGRYFGISTHASGQKCHVGLQLVPGLFFV